MKLSSSIQRYATTVTRSVQCTSRISFQWTEDSLSAFTPWATLGFTVSFILQWTVYNTNNVWHVGKSLLNKIFVYNFYYTYFSKTNPRKNIYLCLAVLYKNTAVSFKSNITKIYYCWPPVLDAILFQKNICISDLLTILVCDICYNAR